MVKILGEDLCLLLIVYPLEIIKICVKTLITTNIKRSLPVV
jgi:hypothetical protein